MRWRLRTCEWTSVSRGSSRAWLFYALPCLFLWHLFLLHGFLQTLAQGELPWTTLLLFLLGGAVGYWILASDSTKP